LSASIRQMTSDACGVRLPGTPESEPPPRYGPAGASARVSSRPRPSTGNNNSAIRYASSKWGNPDDAGPEVRAHLEFAAVPAMQRRHPALAFGI